MGGFKPSRADIAGSTIVGSATTDVHEFTGSVNITGSLTINGAGVAPGGAPGGATTQIQYNDSGAFAGSANLTFDGSSLRTTGSLYISSSAEGSNVPLLRIDHPGSRDDNPILFVTGSGFVGIGVLEPTYVLQVAASFTDTEPGGTNKAFKVESDGGSEWFSINGGTISFNAGGGIAKAGGVDLGQRFNIVDVFGTKGALGIGQYPGSPHNVIEVNSTNSDQGGDWFVVDQSGSVGIGVTSPTAVLHISSSTGTDLFKVEHLDSTDNPIFVITGSSGGRIGILTDTPSAVVDIHPQNSPGNNEVKIRGSAAVSHFYTTAGEDTYIRGGTQSSHVVLSDVRNTGGTINQKLSIGDAGTLTTAKMHLSSSDTPTVMAVTSNSGSILTALENQRVGIGTGTPIQTLSVSGSAAFSGAFGSTAIETKSTSLGTLSATDGVSIIDLTAAAINTSFAFFIDNGTFTGQQKTVYVKTIVGADGANSNDATLQGSNIDSDLGNPVGSLSLSASDAGFGFGGLTRGGAVLLWDGADWAPISVTNLNWS